MRIMRGTGSRLLPCGCLIGLYETYSNRVVALVDNRHPLCPDSAHRVDAVVDPALLERRAAPVDRRDPEHR